MYSIFEEGVTPWAAEGSERVKYFYRARFNHELLTPIIMSVRVLAECSIDSPAAADARAEAIKRARRSELDQIKRLFASAKTEFTPEELGFAPYYRTTFIGRVNILIDRVRCRFLRDN